jgi:ADP-ribose pyrophosphatase YjhB (NUDIX family)
MNESKIVVTVALFTVLEDVNLFMVPSSLVSIGSSTEKFGMGLFAITRRSNSEAHQSETGLKVLHSMAVGSNESVDQSAQRLVTQELGIQVPVRLRQTRIFDDPNRQSGERVISITYWGFVNLENIAPVLGGKDQVGLELVNGSAFLDSWARTGDLADFDGVSRFGGRYKPNSKRGHERIDAPETDGRKILDIDHDDMVFNSWRRLRYAFGGQLDPFRYLAATALPEAFRLSDLKELQDVCRGERSQVDQFRRSVLSEDSFIAQSLEKELKQKRPGKPAVLYSLQDWADPSKDQDGKDLLPGV